MSDVLPPEPPYDCQRSDILASTWPFYVYIVCSCYSRTYESRKER